MDVMEIFCKHFQKRKKSELRGLKKGLKFHIDGVGKLEGDVLKNGLMLSSSEEENFVKSTSSL